MLVRGVFRSATGAWRCLRGVFSAFRDERLAAAGEADDPVGRECEQTEHRMAGAFRGFPHADMTGAERVLAAQSRSSDPVLSP